MANDIKSMTEMKDLLRIENGEKVKHTFSDQEYINRQSKLRAYMAANSIDASFAPPADKAAWRAQLDECFTEAAAPNAA